jgi:hypothetical protein
VAEPIAQSLNPSSRTCIITMVHGTWGRGFFFLKNYNSERQSWWHELLPDRAPAFFVEGSFFRSALESELRKQNIVATFRLFQWSGANSVLHRACAADDLSSLLASDPDSASSVVIAHNHGGNVALRAISKLGARGARIHLVTLATPFLRVFPTWSGPTLGQVVPYFLFAIAFGFYLLVPFLVSHLPQGSDSRAWTAVLSLVAAVITIASPVPLARLLINPSPPPAKRQLDRKTWASRPFRIAEVANYDSAGPHAPNLLVIRGVDDEAALALASGSAANAINRLTLRVMWKWLMFFGGLIVFGYWLEKYGLIRLPWIDAARVDQIGRCTWLVLMVGTFFLLILPGLLNIRFGREFLIGAFRCEIAADSAPDSIRARIVTLEAPYQPLPLRTPAQWLLLWWQSPPTTSRMRHKIYNYPGCASEIAKWLNEQVQTPAPSA